MTAKNIGVDANISAIRMTDESSAVATPATGFAALEVINNTLLKIDKNGSVWPVSGLSGEVDGTNTTSIVSGGSGTNLDFSGLINPISGDPNVTWDSGSGRVVFPLTNGSWLITGSFGLDNTAVPAGTFRRLRVKDYGGTTRFILKESVSLFRYQVLSFACVLINSAGFSVTIDQDSGASLSLGFDTGAAIAYNPLITYSLIG